MHVFKCRKYKTF